jgi:ferredoxin
MGTGSFENQGPIKIGMAFVDRGRCLPWAMDLPCIVCQENCPVSPKAIFTREIYQSVREHNGIQIRLIEKNIVETTNKTLERDRFATGDYYLKFIDMPDFPPFLITENNENRIEFIGSDPLNNELYVDNRADILILLQQPYVDPEKCIGCGICQHECPVKGKRAIRINAENESRNRKHSFLLSR